MQEEIPAKYRELTDKVKKYNEAYEAGEPLVTDYEYDMLMLQIKKMEKDTPSLVNMSSPTQTVGAPVKREAGVTVTCRRPVRSDLRNS